MTTWTPKNTVSSTWDKTDLTQIEFLLQETEDFLLLEDGSKIVISRMHGDWTRRTPGSATWS